MRTLLQWLVEHTWIFYTVCIIGAIVYLVRAMTAHRDRDVALFTIEREVATSQAVRAWMMFFIFIIVGLAVFASTTFFLPESLSYTEEELATPTPKAGVEPVTPATTPTPTEMLPLPTFTPLTATAPITTPPPATLSSAESTLSPTPEPTELPTATPTPETATSGALQARFGDFAQLIGYSLPTTEIAASESLVLTLRWQGTESPSPMDYMVFSHLLSQDGRLIAQHDGMPANGNRPTTTWSPGEIIVDPHAMTFKAEARDYTGSATIAVGLYDPNNPGNRVSVSAGGDYVVLPVTINVVSQ